MYKKSVSQSKISVNDWSQQWKFILCFSISFTLLSFLIILPKPGISETSISKKQTEGHEKRKEGFPRPRKGPITSELRENLDPGIPGPETVIRRYEDAQGNEVQEFLINGGIFQIHVTPVNGIPYFLIDSNGDGLFEERFQGNQPRLIVPQWMFHQF